MNNDAFLGLTTQSEHLNIRCSKPFEADGNIDGLHPRQAVRASWRCEGRQ